MAVIKVIKSGNCTIEIDDEYCKNVTPEEKQKRLENIADIYYQAWLQGKLKEDE